jgi:hypothetical protein
MAVDELPSTPSSPAKRRKVKTDCTKSWAKCQKPKFADWKREDYLTEFELDNADWDVLDAQVRLRPLQTLIKDEKAAR